MTNVRPPGDVAIGHSAPWVDDSPFRLRLLQRLKQVAPNFAYEIAERPFKPTTIKVLDSGQEAWTWVLPQMAYGRWILTVDEFLLLELWRLTGKMETFE